ncbi:hypothetical protein M5689_024422 [Euphorbia peplus]|nr:hypothetical protein M5689_024422 [Euphorbia peplus]
MAYVPPHKRHSLDKERQLPSAELLAPLFKKKLILRPEDSKKNMSGKIIYANSAISRWFAVGLSDEHQLPSHIHLKPVSLESIERRSGEKPLVLVNSRLTEENIEPVEDELRSPWAIIAENVKNDLLTTFEGLRSEMHHKGLESVKPTLVARFGKILFHGNPMVRPGNVQRNQFDESISKRLKRSVYTNVLSSYMDYLTDVVVPNLGFSFEDEKDIYHVKLSDNTRPDSTLSCKCSVQADKKLLLYKVELNQVRQMVVDIACLDKNLDLRLMLCTKRILTALSEDEMENIRELINLAVLDVDVKGGLRWPLGKASSGNRYNVVGVWHTRAKAYTNPSSLRLKVRHADRFDFMTGTGEASREAYMKLKGVVSELQEKGAESDAVSSMLKDNLRLIWEHFFPSEPMF